MAARPSFAGFDPVGLKERTVDAIRATLEFAGVEFIAENDGGPGVRLRKAKKQTYKHGTLAVTKVNRSMAIYRIPGICWDKERPMNPRKSPPAGLSDA